MKKLLTISIVTCLLYGQGAEAMWARAGGGLCKKTALVKAVAATGALGAGVYAYKNRDNLQDKAVKTGLNLIQEYAPQDKKDQYASRVFTTLKKYKPALLSSTLDYYANRFANAIATQQKIAQHEESAFHEFTQVIAPDITKFPLPIIDYVMQNNPQARSLFVDAAVNDIKNLNEGLTHLLVAQYFYSDPNTSLIFPGRIYDDNTRKIIDAIQANFKDVDARVLRGIVINFHKEVNKAFHDLTVKNITKKYAQGYIEFLCSRDPFLLAASLQPTFGYDFSSEMLQELATAMENKFNEVQFSMVKELLACNASFSNFFTRKIIECIDMLDAITLSIIMKNASYRNRGKMLNALRDRLVKDIPLTETFSIQDFSAIPESKAGLIDLYNHYSIPWYRPALAHVSASQAISQTEAHALVHQDLIKKEFSDALKDLQAVCMLNSLHEKEKEEERAGNFTFVHGCAWDWDLKQDIFTHLMEIKLNKKFEDYRFLRFKDNYNVTQVDESVHATLAQGNAEALRSDILFMNHAVFGNSSRKGSCTFDYWYHNYDQSVNNNRNLINAEELFAQVGMRDFFTRYKKDIQNLERLHKKAENKGVILLISANQEMVRQNIYPTTSGGAKVVVKTKDKKTLDSAQAIITQLKQNPTVLQNADAIEYGLLCSNKFVLNPDKAGKDIKIFPYSLAHGTPAYQEYCNARDQLMAKIKRDIYEQNHPELVQESRVRSILAMSM
ncbi:MAG: hypothetical protein WC707_00820 [Candidatus Babeliaceae bacterium]